MSGALVIRQARPEDAPVMTDLILRSKQSNGYDDAFMAACADELSVSPKDIETGRFWVAERGTLLGCVRLDIDGRDGQIGAFFVDPEAKRRGVGRALWGHVIETVIAKGIKRLTLDADPEAVPFYHTLGFEIIGETPSGSIPGRMLPLMAMDL